MKYLFLFEFKLDKNIFKKMKKLRKNFPATFLDEN